MSIVNKPFTFSPNTSISSSQMNSNFDDLYDDYNGGISAANLANNAVTTDKIADDNVTAAKIADGAIDAAAKLNTGVVTSEKLTATIACRAYRNAAFTVTAGGGAEKLILEAESYDTGSNWDTTNGRFVAPVTGYYQVNSHLTASNLDIDGQLQVFVYVNGAFYSYANSYAPSATADPSVSHSDLVPVTAGQYIEMYMDCTTTESGAPGANNTWMSIHFVGA